MKIGGKTISFSSYLFLSSLRCYLFRKSFFFSYSLHFYFLNRLMLLVVPSW